MKGFTKACLIAGGVCILLGGGIAAIAAFLGGRLEDAVPESFDREAMDYVYEEFSDSLGPYQEELGDICDHWWLDKEEYSQDRMVFKSTWGGDIDQLEIEAEFGKVALVQDPDAEEILICSNQDETWWSCDEQGKRLKLRLCSDQHEEEILRGQGDDLFVIINVPEGHKFKKVDLKTGGRGIEGKYLKKRKKYEGTLIEMDSLSAGELKAQAEIGTIKIEDGDIASLEVSSQVGTFEFQGTVSGNIEAECTAGEVCMELDELKEDFNYEVECSVGAVTIGEESIAHLAGRKDIDNGAERKMKLDCEVGAIQVSFANEA